MQLQTDCWSTPSQHKTRPAAALPPPFVPMQLDTELDKLQQRLKERQAERARLEEQLEQSRVGKEDSVSGQANVSVHACARGACGCSEGVMME